MVGAYVGRMPYPAINRLFDDLLPPGLQHYWKGAFVRELPDEAVAVHVEHGGRVPSGESGAFLFPIDGACHRVPRDGSAFAWRDAAFATVIAGWPIRRQRAQHCLGAPLPRALRPYSEEGGYVNFMSADDRDRVGSTTANHAASSRSSAATIPRTASA